MLKVCQLISNNQQQFYSVEQDEIQQQQKLQLLQRQYELAKSGVSADGKRAGGRSSRNSQKSSHEKLLWQNRRDQLQSQQERRRDQYQDFLDGQKRTDETRLEKMRDEENARKEQFKTYGEKRKDDDQRKIDYLQQSEQKQRDSFDRRIEELKAQENRRREIFKEQVEQLKNRQQQQRDKEQEAEKREEENAKTRIGSFRDATKLRQQKYRNVYKIIQDQNNYELKIFDLS